MTPNGPRLLLLLLLPCVALAGSLVYGDPDVTPSRFVSCELLSIGGRIDFAWARYRMLSATLSLGSLRLGTALVEGWYLSAHALPLHVGYTLVRRPLRTAFFYGMVPEVYADAAVYLLNIPIAGDVYPSLGRLAIGGGVDYYGVGARAELGILAWNGGITPVMDVEARILVGNFGF